METAEFIKIRRELSNTQKELARLLGVSAKAVQSFEQGWRAIPPYIERQLLFLLYLKRLPEIDRTPCWARIRCSMGRRQQCPAWQLNAGDLCWFINGTICEGKVQKNWKEKMQLCRRCKNFKSFVPL